MAASLAPVVDSFLATQNYAAYTPDQHAVWADLVRRIYPQLEKHAAKEYLEGFEIIGLEHDCIPRLDLISARLTPRTGWSSTPVTGFLPASAFFEMLATSRFPTTTWLRSRNSLTYTPEPDIFHDVFGHVPMHAHPVFAGFLQHYGRVCASISDSAILEKLGRIFWYTVEFGVIREHNRIKLYGSGLISSQAEGRSVIDGRCAIHDFTLEEVIATPVKVNEQHHLLFAVESFDQIYETMHRAERLASQGRL